MSVSFCVCRRLWLLAFQTAMKSVQVHLVLNVMLSSCMNRSPSYAHLEIFAWLEEKIWVPSSVPRVMKSLAACVRLCSHRVSYKISASENPLTARWDVCCDWMRQKGGGGLDCPCVTVRSVWRWRCKRGSWNKNRHATKTSKGLHYSNQPRVPQCTSSTTSYGRTSKLSFISPAVHTCAFNIIQHRDVFSQEHL